MDSLRTFFPNKWLLLVSDAAGMLLIYVMSYGLRFSNYDFHLAFSESVLFFAAINFVVLYIFDLYRFEPEAPLWVKPFQTISAVIVASAIIVIAAYLTGNHNYSGMKGRGVFLLGQFCFSGWAAFNRFWLNRWLRSLTDRSRWLVVGGFEFLNTFVVDLKSSQLRGCFTLLCPDLNDLILARSKVNELEVNQSLQGQRKASATLIDLGTWDELDSRISETWSAIVVCGSNNMSESMAEKLMAARLCGMRVLDLADFYEQAWYKVPVFYLERSWFAMTQGFDLLHNPVGLRIKRICDILGAILILLLSAPILLLTIIAIKIESRGPVLFEQVRVGENGNHFTIYKLRSMTVDAEKNGAQWASKGDTRVTRIGRIIRALRIDELPQVWNVIRGDMSFIGPRPERPEFTVMLEKQIPYYNLRHISKPGVTGWAQVMYPYGASVEDAKEKLQFELYYIKNYSIMLDLAILAKTVRVVLSRRGW